MRIITWGLSYQDYARQRELFALRNNGDIEIVAELNFNEADDEIFFRRMPIVEGLKQDYDYILLCNGTKEEVLSKIKEETSLPTQEISINPEKHQQSLPPVIPEMLIPLDDFVTPYHEKTKARQLEILEKLVKATDAQIQDKNWMKEQIYSYGIYPFFKLAKEPEEGVHYSTIGVLQVPEEFLGFCMHISNLHCENAIEIGVAGGGSSYIIAALLYRNNPQMTYSMVDIADHLVHFDKAKQLIPSLEKCIPATSENFAKESYDYCFIDADHSYQGMMTDWENVGKYTRKCLVFHDIFGHEYDHLDGGTVRGWKEIRTKFPNKQVSEFTKFPDFWMGIGMIEMGD